MWRDGYVICCWPTPPDLGPEPILRGKNGRRWAWRPARLRSRLWPAGGRDIAWHCFVVWQLPKRTKRDVGRVNDNGCWCKLSFGFSSPENLVSRCFHYFHLTKDDQKIWWHQKPQTWEVRAGSWSVGTAVAASASPSRAYEFGHGLHPLWGMGHPGRSTRFFGDMGHHSITWIFRSFLLPK